MRSDVEVFSSKFNFFNTKILIKIKSVDVNRYSFIKEIKNNSKKQNLYYITKEDSKTINIFCYWYNNNLRTKLTIYVD